MSGNTGERLAVVTASARSLPPLTYSIDEDMVANMTCTCPPSRSTSAGPAPRYGKSGPDGARSNLILLTLTRWWLIPYAASDCWRLMLPYAPVCDTNRDTPQADEETPSPQARNRHPKAQAADRQASSLRQDSSEHF